MKILVTGARGFIGRNLIAELKNRGYHEIFEYDNESGLSDLDRYTKECDFIFHLAGVNRPEKESDFMEGNFGFSAILLDHLKKNSNKAPVLLTSSIQATLDNPYGASKKAGEDILFKYKKETGAEVFIFRLQNVFGKWCRPNYNSVIATFCYNIANNLPIEISNRENQINLVYIDDVMKTLISAMEGTETCDQDGLYYVKTVYPVKLGQVADMIMTFREFRTNLQVPDFSDQLIKNMYSTYLSYLPPDRFSYPIKMNVDHRGSFTEILKTSDRGQLSVNISKPGITKGNHWHHTKVEKFLVVSGKGVIRFRKLVDDCVVEYKVNGEALEVIDIPPGYTHNITNTGDTDMVTIMWANEIFDPEKPDTYTLQV